jgi:D-alanyl-D-alanine carboxypeptidase (penicillin-binding protein 5/6)
MKGDFVSVIVSLCLVFVFLFPGAAVGLEARSRDPYFGAIAVDAATGRAFFEDHADRKGYPASMVKLMDLLIVLEKVKQGELSLSEEVLTTAEAARMGGTQVFLKEGETFSVEDLLYAMMVRSANDAAVALAIHIAGSKDAFVEVMNRRAQELGMDSTTFHSVHGLPPGPGQIPDVSTARDMAKLSIEVVKHPEALKYTATEFRKFRNGTFNMRTHNPVLGEFKGADGLKTGYFSAAGFSLAATAARDERRVICVVLGSRSKAARKRTAMELLTLGFSEASLSTAGDSASAGTENVETREAEGSSPVTREDSIPQKAEKENSRPAPLPTGIYGFILIIVAVTGIVFVIRLFVRHRKKSRFYKLPE